MMNPEDVRTIVETRNKSTVDIDVGWGVLILILLIAAFIDYFGTKAGWWLP